MYSFTKSKVLSILQIVLINRVSCNLGNVSYLDTINEKLRLECNSYSTSGW